MKTKLLFRVMLFWSVSMFGQTQSAGQLFELKAAVTNAKFIKMLYDFKDTQNFAKKDSITIGENIIFKVDKIKGNKVNFYVLNFKKGYQKEDSKKLERKQSEEKFDYALFYNNKLFQMSLDDYTSKAIDFEFPDRIVFGVLALPFKYRPQKNSSFETQFNLNAALGILITPGTWKNFKVYFQGGAGIGTLILNSTIAKGVEAENTQNVTTISGFTGLMLEYKKVQAGFYFGADKINNNTKFDWESQGKPWFSLGIGFKIFTLSANDKTTNPVP